jgi:hypothetical protein
MSDVTNAPNMTIEQVKLFVDESLELDWEWERIRLLGGEPTLHPKFREICEELIRYRTKFPGVFLQVLSNGLGKLAQHQDWLVERNIDPHVEAKNKTVQPHWFVNTRIVPLDRDPDCPDLPPCGIFGVRGCGIGLTRHGYFLDGAGASIARIAGFNIGVQHLKNVTMEAMLEQAKPICKRCGHWNDQTPGVPSVTKKVSETGMTTGAFWTETLAKYNKEKPVLTVYGSDR